MQIMSDVIIDLVSKNGADMVFSVSGGPTLRLLDAIMKNPNIDCIYTHHEQSAAFAALAYAKASKKLGVAIVTTGPGGTNALTPLLAAWQDSIPLLIISGQVSLAQISHGKNVRQVGPQEFDITTLIAPITKYTNIIYEPADVQYEIEKAIHLSFLGRPGPVWLDIPFDVLISKPVTQSIFSVKQLEYVVKKDELDYVQNRFMSATRPILLAGHGVRLAEAEEEFLAFAEKFQIPFVTSWIMKNISNSEHPLNLGCIGINGQRGANFALYRSDLIFAVGSHLSPNLLGPHKSYFFQPGKVIVLDIDCLELDNIPIREEDKICCDAKLFLLALNECKLSLSTKWKNICSEYKLLNDIYRDNINGEKLNQYCVIDELSNYFQPSDSIVIDGGGTVVYTSFQALRLKKSNKLIASPSISAMGSGLPESIGVAFATKNRVFCLIGDGSLQFNIQELQTIVHHELPIVICVFNNDGYRAIQRTQEQYMRGRYNGSSKESGLSLPDYKEVSKAYKLDYYKVENSTQLMNFGTQLSLLRTPLLCEIFIDNNQQLAPFVNVEMSDDSLSIIQSPLDNMAPLLSEEEYLQLKNLIKD